MKLPNAPLAEVVFELRWSLHGQDDSPFSTDPGYQIFSGLFEKAIKRHGYTVVQNLYPREQPTLGHQIQIRYRKADNQPFPVLQIGPGIFACNMSTDYEWSAFRKLIETSLKAVLTAYPKTGVSSISPSRFELRYLDVFNPELTGHCDFLKFFNKDTHAHTLSMPFFSSKRFVGDSKGHLRISRPLREDKQSSFEIDLATARGGDGALPQDAVILWSKVVKKTPATATSKSDQQKIRQILSWADEAHEVTHDFFNEFVAQNHLKKFAANK